MSSTDDLKPCSDRSCILGNPNSGGMRTQGGCEHLKMDLPETRRLLRRVAERMRMLQSRCAELRDRLDSL